MAIVGAVASASLVLVGIGRLIAEIMPRLRRQRGQRALLDEVSRGPFDPETIKHATKHYIRSRCSNVDPMQEAELRSVAGITTQDLFETVDAFLGEGDTHRHLLLLADSGTGKTSFVLNYYVYNLTRKSDLRHRIALVALGQQDALSRVASIPDKQQTVIFLDAFDEDTAAIENHVKRLLAIMEACRQFRRVVMTCRTQFFPRDEEIPVETGVAKVGPVRAGEPTVYEFRKLYLSPFDDADVRLYIRHRYPFWKIRSRREAQRLAGRIPQLSARPMLLSHIPELLRSRAEVESVHQVYEAMVEAWLVRESAWADKSELRRLSELLAEDLYKNRETRGMEIIPWESFEALASEWEIDLQPWQVRGRSLLNRDATGNLKFAHRSIMEYLFVVRKLRGAIDGEQTLTDQMVRFLLQMRLPKDLCVSVERTLSSLSICAEVSEKMDSRRCEADLTGFSDPLARVWVRSFTAIGATGMEGAGLLRAVTGMDRVGYLRTVKSRDDAAEPGGLMHPEDISAAIKAEMSLASRLSQEDPATPSGPSNGSRGAGLSADLATRETLRDLLYHTMDEPSCQLMSLGEGKDSRQILYGLSDTGSLDIGYEAYVVPRGDDVMPRETRVLGSRVICVHSVRLRCGKSSMSVEAIRDTPKALAVFAALRLDRRREKEISHLLVPSLVDAIEVLGKQVFYDLIRCNLTGKVYISCQDLEALRFVLATASGSSPN